MVRSILPLLAILLLTGVSLHGASQQTRRYSLIVGANNGGAGRVKLKYAVSDAKSLQNVLRRMGGVDGSDDIILVEPDRRGLFNAINRLHGKIRREKKKYRRTELIFYYSGHSDEEGIYSTGKGLATGKLKEISARYPLMYISQFSTPALPGPSPVSRVERCAPHF